MRARTLTEHDFGISKIALARVHVHAGGAEAKARDPSKPGSAPTATWRPLLSPADTSPDDDLLVDRSDPAIAVVTINRPKRRNAMKLAMWRELGRIFDELSGEPELRAVILTGAGGAFCAGADISEFGEVRATVEDGRAYEATGDHCLYHAAGDVGDLTARLNEVEQMDTHAREVLAARARGYAEQFDRSTILRRLLAPARASAAA